MSLEHSSFGFKALVDYLRLKAAAGGGHVGEAAVAAAVVPAHEREEFERLVSFYFPGNEQYVLGDVTTRSRRAHERQRRPGRVLAFGSNNRGQLGDGSTTQRHSPVEIASLGGDNAQVAAGASHSLILKADGRVLAFGSNKYGQLGDGSTTERHSPVEIASLGGDNAQVAAGGHHSLILQVGS